MPKYGVASTTRPKSTNIIDIRKTGNMPGKKPTGDKLNSTTRTTDQKLDVEKKQQYIDNIVGIYEGKGKKPKPKPQPGKRNPTQKIKRPTKSTKGGEF